MLDKIIKYFFLAIIFIAIGYAWRMLHEDYPMWAKQFEIQLRHELRDKQNKSFTISGTSIKVVKWKDGSGVIRVVE